MKLNNKFVYGFGSGLLLVIVFTIILIIGTGQNVVKEEIVEEELLGKELVGEIQVDKYTNIAFKKMDKDVFKIERKRLSDDLKDRDGIGKDGFKSFEDWQLNIEYADYLQSVDPCIVGEVANSNEYIAKILDGDCIN